MQGLLCPGKGYENLTGGIASIHRGIKLCLMHCKLFDLANFLMTDLLLYALLDELRAVRNAEPTRRGRPSKAPESVRTVSRVKEYG